MGVRLYPGTDEAAVVEVLAGVPAGTGQRLRALQERFAHGSDEEFEAIQEDEAVRRYYDFQLFGWGKLKPGIYGLLGSLDLDPVCGQVTDVELAYTILAIQGVVDQIPAGFTWGAMRGVVWN